MGFFLFSEFGEIIPLHSLFFVLTFRLNPTVRATETIE